MNRIVLLYGGVLAAGIYYGGLRVSAAADQPAAGLYSAAQATRGGELYKAKQCALCHGADLGGVAQSPPLSGDDFVAKYADQSILVLFDKVQKTMPATNPGSLTPAQTADLLAYMLSASKYPAGDAELPADRDKLKAIQMPKPAK
jgi:mono/diheme cytochrome c family protein